MLCSLVDHLMCRDGKSGETLLEKRDAKTFAARRNYQTALGWLLRFARRLTRALVADGDMDGALWSFLQGVQHHHGSQVLAAVMDRCPSLAASVSANFRDFTDD